MTRRLLPLLALPAVLLATASAAAAPGLRQPLIANGKPMTFAAKAPWAVLLQKRTAGGSFGTYCSGNLVAPAVVVTAAHCVSSDTRRLSAPAAFRVQAGEPREDAPRAQTVGVLGIAVHPNYRGFTKGSDVAVLSLTQPLQPGPSVQPIPLTPAGSAVRRGRTVSMYGWGETESGEPQGLRKMTTRAILSGLCASGIPGVLCAYNPEQAPCGGDSGAGLIRTLDSGRRELVALDSFGSPTCAPGQPEGYADLTQPSLNRWVRAVMNGRTLWPRSGPRALERPVVEAVSETKPVLRCTGARWTGAPRLRTLWLRADGEVFQQGRSRYYRATERDVDRPIYCASAATNADGSATAVARRGYRFTSLR